MLLPGKTLEGTPPAETNHEEQVKQWAEQQSTANAQAQRRDVDFTDPDLTRCRAGPQQVGWVEREAFRLQMPASGLTD